MQKPTIPKGTRDFGPIQSSKRRYIISVIEAVFRLYGFRSIETPAMENLSVLMGKYGDEGDQLLFKILNSGDFLKKTEASDLESSKSALPKISEKGLRYDLTVPFARYVVMNQHEITFPFKRYQIQPVWRADRPQRGRYREFYQCDADIINTNSGFQKGWNEVELTLLITEVFSKLGLKDYVIKINHRDLLFGIAEYVGMKGQEIQFCVSLDKLDKIGREAVLEEVKVSNGITTKLEEVLDLLSGSLSNTELLDQLYDTIKLGKRGYEELKVFFDSIKPFENNIELDFSLARGLSYYTGMIYEVKPTSVIMGSICGGGRYDDLTGIFGLGGVTGVGISFGLDRLYDVLDELSLFPENIDQHVKVLITHTDETALKDHGMSLIQQLRNAGISAELYPDQAKLKKQFQFADKNQIQFVITIGSEEMESGIYSLKNMHTGEQLKLKPEEIIQKLLAE